MCLSVFSPVARALSFFFFFNDTATTEIYTLSLHDALPISLAASAHRPRRCSSAASSGESLSRTARWGRASARCSSPPGRPAQGLPRGRRARSEEHTSELQSLAYLVCRLLLEKKKNTDRYSG